MTMIAAFAYVVNVFAASLYLQRVRGLSALAASAITLLDQSGTPHRAIDSTLRVIALALIAAAALVMAIRDQLARRGLMAPLSMKQPWPPAAPTM